MRTIAGSNLVYGSRSKKSKDEFTTTDNNKNMRSKKKGFKETTLVIQENKVGLDAY